VETVDPPLSNAPVALLRPLLDDLVQEEFYLEMIVGKNQPTEAVLAVKLLSDRAALWQTNLPSILNSIFGEGSGLKSSVVGYQLSTKNHQLILSLSGDWLVFSFSSSINHQPSTNLVSSIRDRITAAGIPYVRTATNDWVELLFEARQMNDAFHWGWKFAADLPRLTLGITGDGLNVRTTGELNFPQPQKMKLKPWRIPTYYICDPLVSFMAVRGVAGQLGRWEGWRKEEMGIPPNQLFFLAQSPALWSHFLTYPVANASNHVAALGDWVALAGVC
jgi:hypothetical protein